MEKRRSYLLTVLSFVSLWEYILLVSVLNNYIRDTSLKKMVIITVTIYILDFGYFFRLGCIIDALQVEYVLPVKKITGTYVWGKISIGVPPFHQFFSLCISIEFQ